ncbi:MAG: S41 family peptidase, partial [Pseudomonadota bacterium]
MMKRLSAAAAAALALFTASAGAQTPPRDQPLDGRAALADVTLARKALSDIHAGYDRYTPAEELDVLWNALEMRAAAGMTRGDLYLEISRILAAIRCDHTKAEIPDDFEADRNARPTYLPFRFKIFDGRMYVVKAADGVDLNRRDEILTIDGEPVKTLIDAVSAVFPVDGDTDFIKEPSISDFGEFVGPAFEHFMPYLRPIASQATITVRRYADGSEDAMVADRLTFDAYAAVTGEERFSANFVDAIRYEPVGDDAAYLAVDTFINYRKPVSPDKIYRPIFERLADEGRTKLILDLRRNGGGSTDAQVGLVRWIAREPMQQADAVWTRATSIDPAVKEHLSSWQKAALSPKPEWFRDLGNGYHEIVSRRAGAPGGPLKPKKGAFTGDLVLLTSYDNASGVTHLLAVLKAAGRGVFIGEPTGGSASGATAGILAYLTLPESKIRVRIPLQRTMIAGRDQFNPRLGIEPDVVVVDTLES